ncbi:hypothetical protein HYU15_03810, partial [Candidatus Woesearchaeota archaeon]|nr:hypothetical protein [Candidatus Woesearchaeota archaeon]
MARRRMEAVEQGEEQEASPDVIVTRASELLQLPGVGAATAEKLAST